MRTAGQSDREALHRLYAGFFAELETPKYFGVTLESELAEVDKMLGDGLSFLAEQGGQIVGFALARRLGGTRGHLSDIYVLPAWRRRGHATRLARAVADALRERGATHITLSVHVDNEQARATYEGWGFRERTVTLEVPTEQLREGIKVAHDRLPEP